MLKNNNYHWLHQEKAPKILVAALAELGTFEVYGAGNSLKILEWAKEVGDKVGMVYSADSIPWCGLFMGVCAIRAGYEPPDICVRAKEWTKFGVRAAKAMLGDILVLDRVGGGHVGLYVGESADGKYYHILGGNQSDEVNIMMFPESRVSAIRRCPWKVKQPANVRSIIIAENGTISKSEA